MSALEAPAAISVCVVDDDEAVRDSLFTLLESYGMIVHAYPSARAFLDDARKPKSCWLLLDLHMPGMTGLELLELLREKAMKYRVIVITGRGDAGLNDNAMRAGAYAVADKPVDSDWLVRTLNLPTGL